ncbi:hypothetical protein AVEN_243345-1 [Araneus ventricosus]|uniref:Uncharacterized protein n=1 Tax=Araneus ventricosus TaxID=182803 RepID=A0A4Y2HBE7_ARAVE|nr:hypothetical protein AVEN_243345-1 [Araneus ventricosus]
MESIHVTLLSRAKGDEEWLGEAPASPSSVPQRAEYEDYDDDDGDEDGYTSRRGNKSDAEDEDIDHQDAEEDEDENDAEFLFMPSRETRLVLQDDDDQSGPIKVSVLSFPNANYCMFSDSETLRAFAHAPGGVIFTNIGGK